MRLTRTGESDATHDTCYCYVFAASCGHCAERMTDYRRVLLILMVYLVFLIIHIVRG